jgi:hypothetical protein
MSLTNTNRYRPHPELPGVSILAITRATCPAEGDSRGPREVDVLLDTCDVPLASRHTWRAGWHPKKRSFYIQTTLRTAAGRTTGGLHRILLAPEDPGLDVDHINGNTIDNRRSNLRDATPPENQWNARTPRTNTSGFRGVSWDKQHQCWRVRVGVNGKRLHIGLFDDFDEACAVRIAAEQKYHGAFAFSNRRKTA